MIADDTPNPLIHGRSLGPDYYRVSLLFVEEEHMNDYLSIPDGDELLILSDAIKAIVAWPKNLVLLQDEEVSKF